MLELILYDHPDEFFLKKQGMGGTTLVVVPHPTSSDNLKKTLLEINIRDFEVCTIAEFIKNETLSRLGTGLQNKIYKKSQLIMLLARVWERAKLGNSFGQFLGAFNLFTEMRGHTLNPEVTSEILQEYDEASRLGNIYFWKVLEELDVWDEHQTYKALTESYMGGEDQQQVVFYDFLYLSAIQIDWLKALGQKSQVQVIFPRSVYAQTKSTDWIRWVESRDIEPEEREPVGVKSVLFNKGGLNRALQGFYSPRDLNEGVSLCLGKKEIEAWDLLKNPFPDLSFKSTCEIFEGDVDLTLKEMERDFFDSRMHADSAKLEHHLYALARKELEKRKAQDFKKIKIYGAVLKALLDWKSISQHTTEISLLELHALKYVIRLDLPRNSFIPLLKDQGQGEIKGLLTVDHPGEYKHRALCVEMSYPSLNDFDKYYPKVVHEILSQLGPMKRSGLEHAFLQHRITRFAELPNATLFLEKGILERDLTWSKILGNLELTPSNALETPKQSKPKEHLSERIQRRYENPQISVSKLQTYQDCPRKFYFQYVEGNNPNVSLKELLDKRDLGTLEHKILNQYLSEESTYNEKRHERIVVENFQQLLKSKGVRLSTYDQDKTLLELRGFTFSAITELLKIKKSFQKVHFYFEYPIEKKVDATHFLKGSVDCLIHLMEEKKYALIDFKRGPYSIPSFTDMHQFRSIQLMFYLKNSGVDYHSMLFWSYLCLSCPESSVTLFADSETQKLFEKQLHFLEEGKSQVAPGKGETKDEYFKRYAEVEMSLTQNLMRDESFDPRPQSLLTCQYCPYTNLCSKGSYA